MKDTISVQSKDILETANSKLNCKLQTAAASIFAHHPYTPRFSK